MLIFAIIVVMILIQRKNKMSNKIEDRMDFIGWLIGKIVVGIAFLILINVLSDTQNYKLICLLLAAISYGNHMSIQFHSYIYKKKDLPLFRSMQDDER